MPVHRTITLYSIDELEGRAREAALDSVRLTYGDLVHEREAEINNDLNKDLLVIGIRAQANVVVDAYNNCRATIGRKAKIIDGAALLKKAGLKPTVERVDGLQGCILSESGSVEAGDDDPTVLRLDDDSNSIALPEGEEEKVFRAIAKILGYAAAELAEDVETMQTDEWALATCEANEILFTVAGQYAGSRS